jgi:hypothetical protein
MHDVILIRAIPTLYGISEDALEETPWEAGRLAAMSRRAREDNPFDLDSVAHAEWIKGFSNGCSNETQYVQATPERAFWANVNNVQIRDSMSVLETATTFNVSEKELIDRMTFYRFYDEDGIPLFEQQVA